MFQVLAVQDENVAATILYDKLFLILKTLTDVLTT